MNRSQREYLYRLFWDIFFPRHCIMCGQSGVLLCTPCLHKLPHAEKNPSYCSSLYNYKSPTVKKIILYLKKNKSKELTTIIGKPLSDVCKDISSEYATIHQTQKTILVPIPISRTRLLERGFNQSKLIAESLLPYVSKSDYTLQELLQRTSHRKKQSTITSRQDRLKNMKNVFVAKKILPKEPLYIIIDDVTSTGATIQEAKRALQKAGARHIAAVTVAH